MGTLILCEFMKLKRYNILWFGAVAVVLGAAYAA